MYALLHTCNSDDCRELMHTYTQTVFEFSNTQVGSTDAGDHVTGLMILVHSQATGLELLVVKKR